MEYEIEQFKSGSYQTISGYQYFLPSHVNRPFHWKSTELNQLLEQAALKVGELNSFSRIVPDVDMFIKAHITKEATTSSRIEGTRTGMEDAFLVKGEINPEEQDDWQEIQNYIKAMNFALKSLKKIPLSNRLICDSHKKILSGVRGKHKNPGEFRKSQNWLGGISLKDAAFIPPAHHELPKLLSDFEFFLHNSEIQISHLIRIAIVHYQFETIHPFLDGNGRVGRLLITLYLVSSLILDKPLLYLSDFFEKHKDTYYEKLTRVRVDHDLKSWLIFFLTGIIETAGIGITTLTKIIDLKERTEKKKITSLGKRSQKGLDLFHELFKRPIVTIQDVEEIVKLTPKSANLLVDVFIDKKILVETTGYGRNRMFVFKEYLSLFEN